MKNSFEKPRYHDDRHGHRQAQRRSQQESRKQDPQEKQRSMKQEDILDQLEKQIDEDASNVGLVIAQIFKTLVVAHGALPAMDLKTDLFHVVVNEACISVDIFDPDCVKCPAFQECCGENDSGDDRFGGSGFWGDFDDDDSDEYDEYDEEDGDEFED